MNPFNRRKKSTLVTRWSPQEALLVLDFLEDLKAMIKSDYDLDICDWCEQTPDRCEENEECPF